MTPIEDHSYLKTCAQLASSLSISLSAARRKVELFAAKQGIRGLDERKQIAEKLLKESVSNSSGENDAVAVQLDNLLTALAEDENFMIED
tara:strand:- start:574 stop:843 length:270 start_codon:yes stop_codon:yes gene_type:complete